MSIYYGNEFSPYQDESYDVTEYNTFPLIGTPWFEITSYEDYSPITTISFDQYQELIWIAQENGKVFSLMNDGLEKYTSFPSQLSDIRYILSHETGILTLSENCIKFHERGGLTKAFFKGDHLKNLQSIIYSNQLTHEAIIVGGESHLLVFDLITKRLLKETTVSSPVSCLKSSSFLCCGHTNGIITLRDPRTFNIEHTIQGHTGGVIDFDVYDNLLVSTGWTKRSDLLYSDPFIKVFDLRAVKPLTPVHFVPGPFLCKFHPTMNCTLVVVSQLGAFQFINFLDHETIDPNLYQTEATQIVAFDVSTSGELLAFADTSGIVKRWSDREDPKLNVTSLPIEPLNFDIYHSFQMDENSPLDIISIPFQYQKNLLSNWDYHSKVSVPPPPAEIDTSIFPGFKQVDFVGYALNPGLRRNQTSSNESRKSFRKIKKLDALLYKGDELRPPKAYRYVEIKHTKLGIEEFDFKAYNKTVFCGLENILPNSYCNSGLQVFYFIPQLRSHMINHLCSKEFCLSCELGFLFYMLDVGTGTNCQGSNFLRTFRQIPQASGLGLVEPPADDQLSLIRSIENFNRFVLEQFNIESTSNSTSFYRAQTPLSNLPIINELFGSTCNSQSKCLSCKQETIRETRPFQYDMVFPDASKNSNESFASILKSSLKRETHTKAWCEKCSRYQLTEQSRQLKTLPNILCINTASSKSDIEFWKSKQVDIDVNENKSISSWLPFYLKLSLNENLNLSIEENPTNKTTISNNEAIYELTAVISHVYDPSKKASKHSHLVAQIKVNKVYKEFHNFSDDNDWFLFNDFLVTPIHVSEVVDFSFKNPCIIYFTRVDLIPKSMIQPFQNIITKDVFFEENPFKIYFHSNRILSFIPLTIETIPKRGDLVAIDAEFVSLGAEETEIRADGTKIVVNPCHFSLARVTVLWGNGPMKGKPFIDDYIVTSEPVVDYLTKYSGISPGDLDPKISKHYVTTLKSVYLKLRYLVDSGCKFVGHGLVKDFRIINIFVPKDQVFDTVEIFHLHGQRKISLKFLANYLMNMEIQSDVHDSIEDARTALFLYYKYLEMEKQGIFQTVLQKIYEYGRQTNWKGSSS